MYVKDVASTTNLISITDFMTPGDYSYIFTATGFETNVIFHEAGNASGSVQICNFTLEEVEAENGYRFGFNGKENDGETQTQDYGFRIYNNRLGRFLSVDPLFEDYPYYSAYQFSGNSPIQFIDLDGAEPARLNKYNIWQSARDNVNNGGNKCENAIVNARVKNQKSMGTIKPFIPNAVEKIKDNFLTVKEDDGYITKAAKFAGGVVYGSLNDLSATVTNLIGMEPTNLEGHNLTRGTELTDATIGTLSTLIPTERIFKPVSKAAAMGLSKFANTMLTQAERKAMSQSAKHLLHKKHNAKVLNLKQLNKKGKETLEKLKDAGEIVKTVAKDKKEKEEKK
ncbi:MAG: RHS repeat-associated core domain-containing protein, partial [Bacteroidota bacterium]